MKMGVLGNFPYSRGVLNVPEMKVWRRGEYTLDYIHHISERKQPKSSYHYPIPTEPLVFLPCMFNSI